MSQNFDAIPSEMVQMGKGVMVKPFSCLGFTGFGFQKNKRGKFKIPYKRNPHNYKLVLGDRVEIGACCVIDRGSWRESKIGNDTKIDNMVHTGHNTQIGDHCLIAVGTTIGGSCTIGDYCDIGMNVCIKQHLKIAHHVTIGMGAVVTKDITEPYTTWVGNPARKLVK